MRASCSACRPAPCAKNFEGRGRKREEKGGEAKFSPQKVGQPTSAAFERDAFSLFLSRVCFLKERQEGGI